MPDDVEDIRKTIKKYEQDHLLNFWDELDEEQRERFLQQLQSIKFEEAKDLFENAMQRLEQGSKKLDELMHPIPDDQFGCEETTKEEVKEKYRDKGLYFISNSEVAVVLLAGGQGTRLGVTYPKGMATVDLPSGKTLFQLQAERIKRLKKLAKDKYKRSCKLYWYIMTSEATNQVTKRFFEKNYYFGIDADDVVFFQQGCLPCFDFNGKIILDQKGCLALSPDGNGGLYSALKQNGVLEDMERRGVKYIHAHSVDNVLVKVADPLFIGYCVDNDADCGAKVVKKSHPTEAVGVVCKVGDRFRVVEYSEISQPTAELRDPQGNLVFRAGNICNHFFTVDFLKKVCSRFERELKLHIAKKKIPYVDASGERIKPTQPNGIKMEKFIFDVFEFAEKFVTWEVPRDVDFSPLKNCESVHADCPSTAKRDLLNLHKKYIESSGGFVEEGVEVEISPLLSYAGENLEFVKGKVFREKTELR